MLITRAEDISSTIVRETCHGDPSVAASDRAISIHSPYRRRPFLDSSSVGGATLVRSSAAAAFVVLLQRCGHESAISLHGSRAATPSFCCSSAALASTADERFLTQRQSRTHAFSIKNMSAMFGKPGDDTDGDGAALWQLSVTLPTLPKKRQNAFVEALIGFVKARDAESALALYDVADELECRRTENVFNAVLSLCEGEKAS